MEDVSGKQGYLKGILVTIGLLFIGYLINPVFGALRITQLTWPQNLYFILLIIGIGLSVGAISDSKALKQWFGKAALVPAGVVIVLLGVGVLIFPGGLESSFYSKLYETPVVLLTLYVFLSGGIFMGYSCRSLKSEWSSCLLVVTLMVFSFSTVIGQHDYYNLTMRIGTDRALFEAEGQSGLYYRLPFAVKLLSAETNDVGGQTANIRFFDTVSEYEDVAIEDATDYRLKGWVVKLIEAKKEGDNSTEFVDLSLVFDRWIELKYIGLALLLISLLVKIKY